MVKSRTRDMAYTALMAAFICVAAPFQIPIGPVPITLATFAIFTAAATLGMRRGAAATALYVAVGAIGLPVFTGFSGGLPKLAGATGGFIAGYILCAAATGLIADMAQRRAGGRARQTCLCALGMAIGMILCYTAGTAWFAYLNGGAWDTAFAVCVAPFLPFDAAKIAVASVISPAIRARIRGDFL
ncbi:MAG: biotin transporter BioY [Oscillospiraceae bacterium]|jgi:biotin transport system substrate-specific component|nr:biotin transporter BioY [Oscillospiraceae bacterium]